MRKPYAKAGGATPPLSMLCSDRGVCALLGFPVDAVFLGQALIAGALLILGVLSLLSRGAPGQPSRTWPSTVMGSGGSLCGWALWPGRPPLSQSQKVALADATLSSVAVCMAGAARTIVHPVVIHTHRHHLLKPLMNADLFAVVNLGKDTTHSGLNRRPESELTQRGTERWRVHAALTLLGARVILFQEDQPAPRLSTCEGYHAPWTTVSMFWNIQLCGEEVRKYEVARSATYAWLVRTRPDTAFQVPVRALTEVALQTHGGFYCTHNDAFFVASASAAPALFALHSLAHDCRWVGNSTLSRGLPASMQCGLRSRTTVGWIWPDCIMRLAAWRHRLTDMGCQRTLNTNGRNFFRAHHCNASVPCVTAGWLSRTPSVFFPMPASESPRDHGNLTVDADIHGWGVATGAIMVGVADYRTR